VTSIACIIPFRDEEAAERKRNMAFVHGWYSGYADDVNPARYASGMSPGGCDTRIHLVDSGAPRFDRGGSRNDGADRSASDLLLFADADTVVPYRQITAGLGILQEHPQSWVILYGTDRYYNLSAAATEKVIAAGPFTPVTEPSDPDDWEHQLTSWAGALLIPRAAFLEAGGYDPRFGLLGWGFEDNAFQYALDTLWGPHQRAEGFALHLWHPRGDADFTSPWIPQSQALANRYRRAAGNPRAMRRLVQEGHES
jgi:hypothetical protein